MWANFRFDKVCRVNIVVNTITQPVAAKSFLSKNVFLGQCLAGQTSCVFKWGVSYPGSYRDPSRIYFFTKFGMR